MDTVRRLELQASLQRELNRQAEEQRFSTTSRVTWLLDQVDNYIDRWQGIGTHSTPAIASCGSDLFHMIEIGAEVTTIELQALNSPLASHQWQLFLSLLEEIRTGNTTECQRLTKAIKSVRAELDSEK